MKKYRGLIFAAAAMILMGCQQSPESSIVVHKDMDKVIEQAGNSDESHVDLGEMQEKNTQKYTADIHNASLRVDIKANANVDIPEADRLSLLRVQQHKITQEECDKIRRALMGDAEIYDRMQYGNIVPRIRFEGAVENARHSLQEHLERMETDQQYAAGITEEENKEYIAQLEANIAKWQKKYEEAPIMVDATAYPADGIMRTEEELLAQNPDPDFVPALMRDWGEGSLMAVTSADNKMSFSARNSENLSNGILFAKNPIGTIQYIITGTFTDDSIEKFVLKPTADVPKMPDETCNISMDDAKEIVNNFLQEIGVSDYIFSEGDKYEKIVHCDVTRETNGKEEDRAYARTCYILRYGRQINGVLVDQSTGTKTNVPEGGITEGFVQKMWPPEYMEFDVNDSGIVEFKWQAPLEVTETVVDSVAMMPFSDISATFERMMPIVATHVVPEYNVNININNVTLRYSRLSERDDFKHGLIVPVWAFSGSRKVSTNDGFVDNMEGFTGVQLAINAIDGSVIDSALGY